LFTVPLGRCLHSQLQPGSSPTSRLAAALLAADVPGSRLRPWLDVLPRQGDSLGAASLLEAELASLVQGYRPVLSLRAKHAAADAAAEAQLLASRPGATRDDACWALQMVRTRAFELGRSASDSCLLAFVPWLDMLNHSNDPCCDWAWDAEEEAMVVTAARALREGEEATVSYGARDNDAFLLCGGFVLTDNVHDSVEVFTSLQDAAAWWVEAGVGVALGGDGAMTRADAGLLAAAVDSEARARAAAEEEEEKEELRLGVCIGPGWQVDERLIDLYEALAVRELGEEHAERAAIAALRLRAAQLLNASPTTMEEDAALEASLRAGDEPTRAACVSFLRAKKSILLSYAS